MLADRGQSGEPKSRILAAMPLLECVPNVSEGRRPAVVSRLAAAAASGGAALLHHTADPDHHRAVFTLAGTPADLHAGLLALYETALAEVDLRGHRGVHPRVGAVDVTPFVPLAGATMPDAIAAARRLGEEVGRRFGLPVYLYEAAATRPERRALPDIRRGGFESFSDKLREAAWAPDFGPARVHPSAGVTVIGARPLLIAFNVILATPEVAIARQVARTVRASNGGLEAVRAIGVFLERRRRAQVSLNLLDYRRTSMRTAFERVREVADAAGAEVEESELIGLAPRAALPADPERELCLAVGPDQILEERLRDAGLG
jgi:glutamate formiminotransferase